MRIEELHRRLLRLSGYARDDLVCRARLWLAEGRVPEVEQIVAFESRDVRGPIPYAMSPELAGERGEPDEIATAVVAATPGSAGLWRCWRFPAAASPWPPPKRMYLVQTTDPVAVAAATQTALAAAGERDPLVEAFTEPDELPGLQRQALARSALLWAAAPPGPLEIVPTYDTVDDRGWPTFSPERVTLDDVEADRVLGYLAAGSTVLSSPELVADVFEPEARVVPIGIRGDGRWLWSEAVAYYVDEYGIAPDPRLLASIREAGYVPPAMDTVAVHRSVSFLFATVDAMDADSAEQTAQTPREDVAGS